MSAEDFEQPADPAQFGTWLAQKTSAEQQAKLDALSAENMSQHRPVHDHLTRSQRGIMDMSGQEQAAMIQDRQATIGSDFGGGGRQIQRLGGLLDHANEAPAPGRYDLTRVDQQGRQPGQSPLWAHMNGLDQ